MNNINLKRLTSVSLAALAVLMLFAPGFTRKVRSDEPRGGESARGGLVVLKVDDRYFPARVPAPSREELDRLGVRAVPFSVNYNPASCDGTLNPWPGDARRAFNYALSIWGVLIRGDQTIEIDACWRTDLAPDVLGSSGAVDWYHDFGAGFSGTWYPVALANEAEGTDKNGDTAEIAINFNANFAWYYGLDGETPAGDHDFVTVVLHEVAHGLGFSGSMNWDDGTGGVECDGVSGHGCLSWGMDEDVHPAVYDWFAANGFGLILFLVFDNNSTALGNQLISNDLFFIGSNAAAANGGAPPKLFAPTVWDPGSSFSHLDDGTYDGTAHALMTHALAFGESAHHPGTIALGVLEDIGWDVPALSQVWVNYDAEPPEYGTRDRPFDTVSEGVRAVYPGGIVWIRPGTYPETLTIYRQMELHSSGDGVATIGAGALSSPERRISEELD